MYDSEVEMAGYTQAAIYSHSEFWIDARIYLGWDDGAAHRARSSTRRSALSLPVPGPHLTLAKHVNSSKTRRGEAVKVPADR